MESYNEQVLRYVEHKWLTKMNDYALIYVYASIEILNITCYTIKKYTKSIPIRQPVYSSINRL